MSERLTGAGIEHLHLVAERHVGDTRVPGLVALVCTGEQVHAEALGRLDVGGRPVARDSLFRISSTTKPITAAATLAVIEEGLIGLEEPVERDPDTWIASLGTLPLLAQPGERWLYNTGASVLGVLLARATGNRSRTCCARASSRRWACATPASGRRTPSAWPPPTSPHRRDSSCTTGPMGRSWGYCQAVIDGGAFGWDGGFGSSWLVDPVRDLIVIVLTQRLFETPTRPGAPRHPGGRLCGARVNARRQLMRGGTHPRRRSPPSRPPPRARSPRPCPRPAPAAARGAAAQRPG